MIFVKSSLFKITNDKFTCGFMFESGFNSTSDITALFEWMKYRGLTGFGVSHFEQLLFEKEEQALEFKRIYPGMIP